MPSQPTIAVRPWRPISAAPSFPILESKLTPAPTHPGLVSRVQLLDWLEASAATPVVAMSAPAGYGKTVLAAEWAKQDPRPFVWLSLDRHDNDPVVLLTYLAVGLDRVEPIDPTVLGVLASRGASISQTVLPRLGAALSSKALPVVLVLDDVHLLQDPQGLDAVVMLVDHLPQGSQLAILSRGEPPLPMARWRAQGRLAGLGPRELAMSPVEAGSLLGAAGVELADAEVAELTRRAEGWPVALYLAALAHKAGGRRGTAGFAFTGDDRFLADYLHAELLAHLPTERVAFLTRTAVLDHLSGPLCDAILETSGSAAVLASLERSNLLVVPLDRQRDWYRYHPLFRELLRGELERHEPELVGELTRRAAHWCQHHGLPEAAIGYAMDAGDTDLAARVAIHYGNLDQAEQDLVPARQLRPQATHALPYYAVQARLELTRAYIALTDVAAARRVLGEVDELLRWRPDLGTLPRQAGQLRSHLDHLRNDVIGTASLTTAELRVLPLLATHLTFREIGQRLYVSQHTVKSQALSIYRKLGATSRGQAVERVQEIGLLAG
jgi:ATP/maltotriose-dependent transcriptional regulator MalT